MKKLKNIIAASLAFFAFGSIANAADEWSFTKTGLSGLTASDTDKYPYIFNALSTTDDYFGNYYDGYGFIVEGPTFNCSSAPGVIGTYVNNLYSISISGNVTKICNDSKLKKDDNKTTYSLDKIEKNGKNIIQKCEETVEGKITCEAILSSDDDKTYSFDDRTGGQLYNSDVLYDGEEVRLYIIKKAEVGKEVEYAVYDSKGNKKIDFNPNTYCGVGACVKVDEKIGSTDYIIVTQNGVVETLSDSVLTKLKQDVKAPDKDASISKAYAFSKSENYYIIQIDNNYYIINKDGKHISEKKWTSAIDLEKKATGIYVKYVNDSSDKLYKFDQTEYVLENTWETTNGNLGIVDNNVNLTVKYKSNDVLKLTRKNVLGDEFKGQFIGVKDNVYYFITSFDPSESYAIDINKNSDLLVLKGKFDASEVYTCKVVDGKYYDKNGDEVSKAIYEKSCSTEINRSCTTKDGNYYDKDGVSVSKEAYLSSCTSLTLDKTSASIKVGETATFKATVKGVSGTVTWKSSDDKIAKVDASGVVTAVAAGETTITASVGDLKTTAKVTVTKDSTPTVDPKVNPTEDPKVDPTEDPKYSCQIVNKVYYDAKGNVVDKDTWDKQCKTPDNPHTGFAISSICVIALAGIGTVIYKVKGKDAFRKI